MKLWKNRFGVWTIRYWKDGRRHQRSTKTHSRRQAEQILQEVKKALASGEPATGQSKYISELEPEILAYYEANRSPKTCEGQRLALKHFRRLCGDKPVKAISFHVVESFKQARLSEGASKKTVNNNLAALSSALGYVKKLGYVDSVPSVEKLRIDRGLPRFLSAEEQAHLLTACSPRIERFVRVALLTGMRPGEVLSLDWDDVDFSAGLVYVRETKGRRDRAVPLHEDLRAYLAGLERDSEKVVGLSYLTVRRFFKRYGRSCTAHKLRHTFASHFVMSGGEITALKEILGHSSVQTTMIYAHLAPEHARREINRLPGLPTGTPAGTPTLSEARRQRELEPKVAVNQ